MTEALTSVLSGFSSAPTASLAKGAFVQQASSPFLTASTAPTITTTGPSEDSTHEAIIRDIQLLANATTQASPDGPPTAELYLPSTTTSWGVSTIVDVSTILTTVSTTTTAFYNPATPSTFLTTTTILVTPTPPPPVTISKTVLTTTVLYTPATPSTITSTRTADCTLCSLPSSLLPTKLTTITSMVTTTAIVTATTTAIVATDLPDVPLGSAAAVAGGVSGGVVVLALLLFGVCFGL